jgi:hypothetical protein
MIEKQIDQPVRPVAVGSIALSRLTYQLLDVETKLAHLLRAAGHYPAGEDRGAHFGMELHGEILAEDERLR